MDANQLELEINFYEENYTLLGQWYLSPDKKQILTTGKSPRTCRFCGKTEGHVTFGLVAHAIPESIGNKSLTSDYECDTCNKNFGKRIENDFGNWSKPMRTIARIRGKKGVPTIRKNSQGGWRIAYDDEQLNVSAYVDDPIFFVDETNKKIEFRLPRDPYTPTAVLKAFIKMALTLMPEVEMQNFAAALNWISDPDHNNSWVTEHKILYKFIPGPMAENQIAIQLLRRKENISNLPYAFMILQYGHEIFQIFIPSPEKNSAISGKPVTIFYYPTPFDLMDNSAYGSIGRGFLDLTDTDIKRGEIFSITCGYDSIQRNEKLAGA